MTFSSTERRHPSSPPERGTGIRSVIRPSERASFSQLLTLYGHEWIYEPLEFPLEWDDNGTPVRGFRPDFYLPERHLFIELTVLDQRLVTKKNRKVRRFRELYPEIPLLVVYQRDFHAIAPLSTICVSSTVEPPKEHMMDRRPYLYDLHVELGAKIVPFGGWEMPLQYATGTVASTWPVATTPWSLTSVTSAPCAVTGPTCSRPCKTTLTNDLNKVDPGRAQYTHLLNDDGFVVDDIIVWWVGANEFDVMPNASNTEGVTSALPGVDVTAERCVLAVQGPNARAKGGDRRSAIWRSRAFSRRALYVPRRRSARRRHGLHRRGRTRDRGAQRRGRGDLSCAGGCGHHPGRSRRARHVAPRGGVAALRPRTHLQSTTLEAGLGWVLGWKKETFRGRDAVERGARARRRSTAHGRRDVRSPAAARRRRGTWSKATSVGTLDARATSRRSSDTASAWGCLNRASRPVSPLPCVLRGREIEAE